MTRSEKKALMIAGALAMAGGAALIVYRSASATTPPVGGTAPRPPVPKKTWVRQRGALVAGDRVRVSIPQSALQPLLASAGQTLQQWFMTNRATFGVTPGVRGTGFVYWQPTDSVPADWPADDTHPALEYRIEYDVGVGPVSVPGLPTGQVMAWALK